MPAVARYAGKTVAVLGSGHSAIGTLIELARPMNLYLAGVAAVFTLGRVAHGLGMDGGIWAKGRTVGTVTTMLSLLGLGVWAVTIALDM